MNNTITSTDRLRGALFGMFIGDALAMPVHWYYNTQALVNDYGKVTYYLRPHNPHPDSILWRSSFAPPPGTVDIRHIALKYQDSPEEGMIANTMCGGDNAGRGAVLGALVGALNGQQGWPVRWVEGLVHPPPVVLLDS